jgi:hypothetical protein
MIKALLDRKLAVVPRQRFGVADVRGVADLHIRTKCRAAGSFIVFVTRFSGSGPRCQGRADQTS